MQLGFSTTLTHLPDTPTLFISEDLLCRRHDELERIGRGAFGEVFKYTDVETGFSVALKCLPIHDNVLMQVNDIIKEVAVHGALLHKNIVHYVGCYRGNDNLYIFLEYMEKGSLKDKLAKLERERDTGYDNLWKHVDEPLLPCDTIMRYIFDILNGLHFLHCKGIIHRDMRSPNILLSGSDQAKIADFGLCKEIHKYATNSGFTPQHHLGNTFFLAPEMIDTRTHSRAGRAVDIWSFGILILEMVYHTLPFARDRDSHVPYMFKLCMQKEIPDIPYFLNEDVKRLLSRCLVFEAAERASTGALLDEFFSHLHEASGVCDSDHCGGGGEERPVRRSRKTGLPDIWNYSPNNPRHRKKGMVGPKGADDDEEGGGGGGADSAACAGVNTPTTRARRTAVCYSPRAIRKKLVNSAY